jgi:hypothetical protein
VFPKRPLRRTGREPVPHQHALPTRSSKAASRRRPRSTPSAYPRQATSVGRSPFADPLNCPLAPRPFTGAHRRVDHALACASHEPKGGDPTKTSTLRLGVPVSLRRLAPFTGKRPAMCASTSCGFSSCLVTARGLLYESKPSIEVTHVTAGAPDCKAANPTLRTPRSGSDGLPAPAECTSGMPPGRLSKSPGQTAPNSALAGAASPDSPGDSR